MIKKLKNWFRDWQLSRKIKNQEYVYIVGYRPAEETAFIQINGIFKTWEGAVAEHKRQISNSGLEDKYEILQYPVHDCS